MEIAEGPGGKAELIKTRCLTYCSTAGNASKVERARGQVGLDKYCRRRPDLSLGRFGKTKRQLKVNEANYRMIVGVHRLQRLAFLPALTGH